MADKKSYSKDEVVRLWSEAAGRKDQYDVREVESVDGEKQTWLTDKDTGSTTVAVKGHGADALRELGENVANPFIEPAVSPKEAVEDNEKHYTSRGVIATPTQPEVLEGEGEPTEVDTSKSPQTPNQKAELTRDQVSSPETSRNPEQVSDKPGVPADKTARKNG